VVGFVKTFFEPGTSQIGRRVTEAEIYGGGGDGRAKWERQLSL